MTLYDLEIGSRDLQFIRNLSDEFEIDYKDIEFDFGKDITNARITNEIIYGLYNQFIYGLSILDNLKEELIETIYCNCIDSRLDINMEDFIEENNLEEHTNELNKLI